MSVGNRIFLQRKLPDPEVMEQFRKLPAANVADTMGAFLRLEQRDPFD